MLSFYLQAVETPEEKSLAEQLYINYRSLMYKTAYSVLRNPDDAEDAVQEAFVRAMKNLSKFHNACCPETKMFLIIIVRNAAVDIYNRNKKTAHGSIEEAEDFIPADYSVEDDFFDRYETERIAEMLLKLPEKDYEVLFLSVIQRLKPKETAKILNIPQSTVRKRKQRAKARLKQLLEKEYGYEQE